MKKNEGNMRIFYQNGKIVTVITPEKSISICRSGDVALSEEYADGSRLLVTDDKGSVLQRLKKN